MLIYKRCFDCRACDQAAKVAQSEKNRVLCVSVQSGVFAPPQLVPRRIYTHGGLL